MKFEDPASVRFDDLENFRSRAGDAQPQSIYTEMHSFDSIPDCIAAFRRGEFLIVLDDANRENEGDLIVAAKHLTPEKAAFMVHHSSGYLCAPLSPVRAALLNLSPMIPPSANTDPNRTAYTITVDAVGRGVTTGISARDRSTTSMVLADPSTIAEDLRRPGHVVPLIAREGGVRERRGHTEATWEFARLAGISPEVGVIGELVEAIPTTVPLGAAPEYPATSMMRAPGCLEFGKRWGIKCCTIEDLVHYVEQTEGKLEQSRPLVNGF